MTKRILYVEDSPQNMLLVRRIMEALNYELLEATDGQAGWEATVRHCPDLILMDLRLPGDISGFDLMRRIRQHPEFNHIPIVVLTAYGYDEAEEAARSAGCDGFLRKPADIRQIRATINEFLHGLQAVESQGVESNVAERSLAAARYTFI